MLSLNWRELRPSVGCVGQAFAYTNTFMVHTPHRRPPLLWMSRNSTVCGLRCKEVMNNKFKTCLLTLCETSLTIPAMTTEVARTRSEERRVGTECVRKSRSRWSPCHKKQKTYSNQKSHT